MLLLHLLPHLLWHCDGRRCRYIPHVFHWIVPSGLVSGFGASCVHHIQSSLPLIWLFTNCSPSAVLLESSSQLQIFWFYRFCSPAHLAEVPLSTWNKMKESEILWLRATLAATLEVVEVQRHQLQKAQEDVVGFWSQVLGQDRRRCWIFLANPSLDSSDCKMFQDGTDDMPTLAQTKFPEFQEDGGWHPWRCPCFSGMIPKIDVEKNSMSCVTSSPQSSHWNWRSWSFCALSLNRSEEVEKLLRCPTRGDVDGWMWLNGLVWSEVLGIFVLKRCNLVHLDAFGIFWENKEKASFPFSCCENSRVIGTCSI